MTLSSDVGKLDKRVAVIDPYADPVQYDNDGQPLIQPRTIATVWADIQPVTGDENTTADRVQSDATHTVRVRYRADFQANGPRWYLMYRTRKFEIVRVLDLQEDRRFLLMQCKEQFTR